MPRDINYRERSFRVDAVVLRHSDWGEADRMLVLFTLEMGKVRAIAKGARKPRSRKAGHLEPFMHSRLLLARGRDLLIVTQAETVEGYLPLRDDMKLATFAWYAVEILDRFTYEEGENRAIFHLVIDTFNRLASGQDPDLVVRYYEIRLLDLIGFRPQLFQCVQCGNEIQPEDQYFSSLQGGVLCPICGSRMEGARPISMTALKYLRHFQRSNYADAARAVLTPTVARELEILMEHYLTYLLERKLNTPPFIRRVRKDASAGNGGEGDG